MLRRSRHALPAFAVALLVLGAQVATTAHWLLVRHERCQEHGLVVHADELHGAHAVEPAPTAHDVDGLTLLAAENTDHGHDHCDVAVLLRDRLDRPASDLTAQAPPASTATVARLAPARVAETPLAVLDYAPKSSPPV